MDRRDPLPIDDYAAESPAEFFAVVSEAFFESPLDVRALYSDVYAELSRFYKQDPATRVSPETSAGAHRAA